MRVCAAGNARVVWLYGGMIRASLPVFDAATGVAFADVPELPLPAGQGAMF